MLDEYPDTAIYFGSSAHKALGGLLLEKQESDVLIFGGGSRSIASGRNVASIVEELCRGHIRAIDWQGIPPEPSVDDVRKMRDAIEKFQPPEVIAAAASWMLQKRPI